MKVITFDSLQAYHKLLMRQLKNGKLVAINECPKCGALIDKIDKCEYCGAKLKLVVE